MLYHWAIFLTVSVIDDEQEAWLQVSFEWLAHSLSLGAILIFASVSSQWTRLLSLPFIVFFPVPPPPRDFYWWVTCFVQWDISRYYLDRSLVSNLNWQHVRTQSVFLKEILELCWDHGQQTSVRAWCVHEASMGCPAAFALRWSHPNSWPHEMPVWHLPTKWGPKCRIADRGFSYHFMI